MMTLEEIKTVDGRFITDKCKELFSNHRLVILQTNYVFKSWYDLFPNSLTTWGPRYVKIPHNTLDNNIVWRCGLWIHEATHEIQYERYGTAGFLARYTIGFQKASLEAEAYEWQNKWLALFGQHVSN